MRNLLLAAMFAATMAAATPGMAMPQEAWSAFLENSYSPYRSDDEEPGWEDILFAEASRAPDADGAVAAFGRAIEVSPDRARAYADAIVGSVVARETCGRDAECAPWDGYGYEAMFDAARSDPGGDLFMALGQNLAGHFGSLGAGRFIGETAGHPARQRIVRHLYEYGESPAALAALIVDAPGDPLVVEVVRSAPADVDGEPDNWDGWMLAVLEAGAAALEGADADAEVRAVYAQAVLARYLNLGMSAEAIALWWALPEDVRATLPVTGGRCGTEPEEAACGRGAGEDLADELAAALWLAGDRAGARAWIAQAEARLRGAGGWSGEGVHMALLDAVDPSRPAADLFPLFVDTATDREGGFGGAGGWAFLRYGPATRRLVADRVRAAGYGSIADAMTAVPPYLRYDRRRGDGELAAMTDVLAPVAARREALEPLIQAAWTAHGGPPEEATAEPLSPYRPEGWTETRLPTGAAPWTPASGDGEEGYPEAPAVRLPAGLEPPVPPEAIVRHALFGNESVILFRSSEVDLSGEIPAPGLWLARTENGRWRDPVYLGLQQHFPYIPVPESAAPLIEDGRLRIEVRVREINPQSITFPPVGLSLLRSEDGIVIERDLADIERDADADGLTDLVERRLLLDPANPDTDGDGLADGRDPMPLTARVPTVRNARTELAAAIIHRLTGHDAGAIVMPAEMPADLEGAIAAMGARTPPPARMVTRIMVGDPTMYAGLSLPFRLIVYTPEQAKALTRSRRAPFYPPEVTVYSSLDEREHLVIWSARWVGGQFVVRCADAASDDCQVEDLTSWIT